MQTSNYADAIVQKSESLLYLKSHFDEVEDLKESDVKKSKKSA